jgi:hypothetical protein
MCRVGHPIQNIESNASAVTGGDTVIAFAYLVSTGLCLLLGECGGLPTGVPPISIV